MLDFQNKTAGNKYFLAMNLHSSAAKDKAAENVWGIKHGLLELITVLLISQVPCCILFGSVKFFTLPV